MSDRLDLVGAAACALVLVASFGCNQENSKAFTPSTGGDYTVCPAGTIVDFSDNQKVICDDLIGGVEEICGFDLTVDPCPCAAALAACTADTAWLQLILDCRTNSVDCAAYITCLQGVGTSPSGCTDPTTWECIVSTADTDSQ